MKEHTNKLAFNYQTLQEAAKHSAAVERANGGKVECELFQGQELATWSYLEICYYKQQGQCMGGGRVRILFVLICRQMKSIFTAQC